MSSHEGVQSPRHQTAGHVSSMNLDGTSDSPQGSKSGSRRGSEAGGSPRKASGSTKPTPFKASEGLDPARDYNKPELTPAEIIGKRVDLPIDAYRTSKDGARFAARPGYNSTGKQILIQLNIFNVQSMPRADIYQYDVTITPTPPPDKRPRALFVKVWNSAPVKRLLNRVGGKWLFDGNKLAWSSTKLPRNEERVIIDLDAEAGRESRSNNEFYCVIKLTKTVRLEYLTAYLSGKASWDPAVLECMNFLDHVMRQKPSDTLVSIKRNFYAPKANRAPLDTFLEVIKGTYSAFRLSDSILHSGTGLSVNVDISNTTFWQCHRLSEIALRMIHSAKDEWKTMDVNRLATICKPTAMTKDGKTEYIMSDAFKVLRRLTKLKFQVNHRGKLGQPKIYTVKRLVWDPVKYGAEGANSRNVTFEKKDGSTTTIFQHFLDQYNIRVQYAYLPVVETTKGGTYPLEVCNIISHQRYMYKLDPTQTAAMIKIAVTRPDKRKADIYAGVQDLGWDKDEYLEAFDIHINPNMAVTKARLLPNPEITFANKKENPGVTGRWDLRGKKFVESNTMALRSWGMVAVGDACGKQQLEAFSSSFCSIYRGHGGNILKPPTLLNAPFSIGDYGRITEYAYKNIGHQNKEWPTMIFFIVPNKNQLVYERIKKNMECRWCVVSQVLQGMNVKKNQAQFCSNVAMKVNSKLGGVTSKIASSIPNQLPFWSCPTMMIGLDVSHGAFGSNQPSMAAMTVSMDRHATRYAASCDTNHWNQEIVNNNKMGQLFNNLLEIWCKTNKATPQHIFYFRDGVSDGQFQQVIDEEVKGIKHCFQEKGYAQPKITVIIATKRHHIRFFPKPGDKVAADRNCNPFPGTLVEHDVTHPFHFDFYLCSHAAIQGTARPVHYIVIYDEAQVKPDLLQKMIYQQCYQYCRSTTPVSLHPAVYYSHLASQRARAHEDIAASQREMAHVGKEGFPVGKPASEVRSGQHENEPAPLLAMDSEQCHPPNRDHIVKTMWYV